MHERLKFAIKMTFSCPITAKIMTQNTRNKANYLKRPICLSKMHISKHAIQAMKKKIIKEENS